MSAPKGKKQISTYVDPEIYDAIKKTGLNIAKTVGLLLTKYLKNYVETASEAMQNAVQYIKQ
jgi:hypothetical protein